MNMLQQNTIVSLITELVLKEVKAKGFQVEGHEHRSMVPVSISARHLHLSKEDLEILFGRGYALTKVKDISQPGQFAAKERVTIIGPKGKLENVRVLGPIRKETQIEISMTDARSLGVEPYVRESGDLKGTPGVVLIGPKGSITLERGCIVAERHIHMTEQDAEDYGVVDGQKVSIRANTYRGGILENVVVRVREDYALDMHIDVDEANAFAIKNGDMLQILK